MKQENKGKNPMTKKERYVFLPLVVIACFTFGVVGGKLIGEFLQYLSGIVNNAMGW